MILPTLIFWCCSLTSEQFSVAGSFNLRKGRKVFLVIIAQAFYQVCLQRQRRLDTRHFMKLHYLFCPIFKLFWFGLWFFLTAALPYKPQFFQSNKDCLLKAVQHFLAQCSKTTYNVPKQESYTESKAKGQKPSHNQRCLKYASRQTSSNA